MVSGVTITGTSLYPEITSLTHNNTAIYPHIGYGIDLRKWINDILSRYGHSIMVRKYDTTRRSQYWNELTKESIGGPAWVYTDHIVKARKYSLTSGGTMSALEMTAPPGIISVEYVIYFLHWNSILPNIRSTDEIYEFQWSGNTQPTPDRVVCDVKYNIIESLDMLGDAGRNEYYKCICKQDVVGY